MPLGPTSYTQTLYRINIINISYTYIVDMYCKYLLGASC